MSFDMFWVVRANVSQVDFEASSPRLEFRPVTDRVREGTQKEHHGLIPRATLYHHLMIAKASLASWFVGTVRDT